LLRQQWSANLETIDDYEAEPDHRRIKLGFAEMASDPVAQLQLTGLDHAQSSTIG